MKTNISGWWKRFRRSGLFRRSAPALVLVMAGGLNATLSAQTNVTTIAGGANAAPYWGYVDGQHPKFDQPSGLAMDPAGNYLFVADYSNNVVRFISSPGSSGRMTYTFTNSANLNITRGITNPIAVAVDLATNVFVLNRGGGTNATSGSLLQFNINYLGFPTLVVTNVSRLTNAAAMAVDGLGNVFVVVQGNTVLRVTPPNAVSVVGVITNRGVNLQGIAVMDNEQLALSDAGTNSGIWLMDTYSTNISNNATKLAGFNGLGDNPDAWPVPATNAIFNRPANIAKAGNGILVVADNGNHRVKLLNTISSTVTLLYGVKTNLWLTGKTIVLPTGNYTDPGGWVDGLAGTLQGSAESRLPFGVVVASDGSVYVAEDYTHVLRHITGAGLSAPVPGYPRSGVAGIGLDAIGNNLYIAVPRNNQVQLLNIPTSQTTTILTAADGLNSPVSVLTDTNGSYDSVYYVDVLNSGTNGSILQFDNYGWNYGPLVTGLNQPTAFTLDGNGNVFIAEQGGAIKVVIASTGISNTVATITNAGVSLQGIAILDNGNIAVSDAGNHVIWSVNPITKLYRILTGQLGFSGTSLGTTNSARLNQPHQLARSGSQLLVADSGNNRLVLVTASGTTGTNGLNPNNATLWFGNVNDPVTSASSRFLSMNDPIGLAVSPAGIIYASEPTNQDIRGLTAAITPPPAVLVVPLPFFSAVAGIALNSMSTELFITDPTNSTVSILNLADNQISVFLDSSSGIYQPVDVALDNNDNVYVLNQGTGGNGSILEFDQYGNQLATVAASLSMPTAMKMDFSGNIFVSELNGAVEKFYAGGSNTTLVTITTNANVRLQGITLLDNGSVVVSDAGNQVLWKIAPATTNAVLFTGVLGAPGTNFGAVGLAKLNKPLRLAETFGGLLIVDSGNNRILVCDDSGTVSKALKSTNAILWFGSPLIDPVAGTSPYFISMQSPVGIAIGSSGTNGIVFDSETIYKNIRGILNTGVKAPIPPPPAPLNLVATAAFGQVTLTWSPSTGATNYNVKRSTSTNLATFTLIGTTTATTFLDTNVLNGSTYYYVVSAVNGGGVSPYSVEASATLPMPPVASPQIGYVDFPATSLPVAYTSVFHPEASFVFNNDTPPYLVIVGEAGSQTFYTYGATGAVIPDPTTNSASAPVGYADGDSQGQVAIYDINPHLPDVTIKAIGTKNDGSPNSAIVQSRFQFVTGNPNISGDNAGQFFISDVTANAHLYYTIDGSIPSPTNGIDLGTVATPTNLWTVALAITSNTLFQVVAVRPNYQNSAVVSTTFSVSNFTANVISFGFGNGEASSDFVASPGQIFYAPVTLSPLSGTTIYSLQFNLTVTNSGPNPGPAITPSAYGFSSMLMKPIPGLSPVVFEAIPPAMFVSTNAINPNPILIDGSTNFTSLLPTNSSLNLLGVGWVERAGATNLYDTTKQNLIQYSIAHDDMFPNSKQPNGVIVGGYAFQVPASATNGQTYQIQIGRPTATADGVGTPNSDVYIVAPTNGSTAGGLPLNALKYVTVGQRKYIAGSVYPFRWFNAGDFGSSNIVSADVEQVFEAAMYHLNSPAFQAPGSDFFDAMDSCGGTYVDLGHGYLEFNSYISGPSALNPLFDGNDTSINQIAFGDGVLDVCDVYVTFRRSLDPSLTWFRRFWNNGQRVADTGAPNVANHLAKAPASGKVQSKVQSGSTVSPKVNFTAGDITNCSSGQVLQIPITATVLGNYPLRVLMLNLTVEPLDGSPALTVPIQFSQNAAALGAPYTTGAQGNGNYSAVWLNSTNAGLTGTVTIGTLSVTIPNGVSANSAYAVHFDHASASPNGLASFPKSTLTGLITSSSRNNSSYGDGIPDSWRLRWFGTANNLLSASNACPSGDGIKNWMKYVAGVDPNTANDFPSVNPRTPVPSGSTAAIHWPTVNGKQYVILSSDSLFPGVWRTNAIVTGTGADVEYDDNTGGTKRFYRVQILP